jgi:hypothetical protein
MGRLGRLALVVACCAHGGAASAQLAEDSKAAANAASRDSPPARRIMVSVGRPAESLAAQPIAPGPIQAPAGTSAGAGIVGALAALLIIKGINDSRERPAQDFAAGIDQALTGVDLQGEVVRAISRELERTGHLRGALLEDVQDLIDMEQPGLLVRITEGEIYTVDSLCSFAPGFLSLHVSTTVRLWLKDGFKPVYTAKLEYASKDLADPSEPRKQWIADNGRALLQALREGIEETARLIVAETAKRGPPAKEGKPLPAGLPGPVVPGPAIRP